MRPDRFDPARGSLLTLLLADCHGRSIDKIRSESSRRAREHDDIAREQRQRSDEPDMSADLCDAEDSAQIAAALGGLCDGERDAIWLAYYGDNSYRAVAELLQVPEGTVKARIRRGLGRLRSDLSQTGGVLSPRST